MLIFFDGSYKDFEFQVKILLFIILPFI